MTCADPLQSKTWLLGEVGDTFEADPQGSFLFPFHNGTGHPVQIKVRAIGCSCYQVRRGETRLKVGDLFELGTDATEVLTLHPSRPTVDRSAESHFSVEYERIAGEPAQVIECQGTLVSLSEFRVNPSLMTAEFVQGSPAQTVRLEVTRTARVRELAEQKPVLSGWPTGSLVEDPEMLGPAVELGERLWKQSWRVSAAIVKPETMSFADEFWSIRVSGSEPDSPSGLARLMVKFRSGLSGPRIVHFGEVSAGQSLTRKIQILARDDRPFRILGPTSPGSALSIQPDSPGAVKSHWGTLTFSAPAVGDYREIMQVSTDHPEQPSLDIEIRAHVTP